MALLQHRMQTGVIPNPVLTATFKAAAAAPSEPPAPSPSEPTTEAVPLTLEVGSAAVGEAPSAPSAPSTPLCDEESSLPPLQQHPHLNAADAEVLLTRFPEPPADCAALPELPSHGVWESTIGDQGEELLQYLLQNWKEDGQGLLVPHCAPVCPYVDYPWTSDTYSRDMQ